MGCAAQDEIVSATAADSTTPTSAQTPATHAPAAPVSNDDEALAARRKQQDDADWAQAQKQYQTEQQQKIN
jgi:hypothetical protein